jgi:hypothetical protein
VDLPGVPNTNFYSFDFTNPEKITWKNLTAELVSIPSPSPTTNTPIILGLSIGLGTLGIVLVVVFSLIYRRMKKNKNTTRGVSGPNGLPNTILQVSNDDIYNLNQYPSAVNQQDSPVYQPEQNSSAVNQNLVLSTPNHSPKGMHEPIFLIPSSDRNS